MAVQYQIQPQPLRVLEILVVQAGTLVTREELRQRIWDEATLRRVRPGSELLHPADSPGAR